MRVFYRSRLSRRRLVVYAQVGAPVFCCERMRERWGSLIGFGTKGHPCTTSREVCIFNDYPQANSGPVLGLVPIDFCPFCGEAVEACWVK